jgi:hypothetical protein
MKFSSCCFQPTNIRRKPTHGKCRNESLVTTLKSIGSSWLPIFSDQISKKTNLCDFCFFARLLNFTAFYNDLTDLCIFFPLSFKSAASTKMVATTRTATIGKKSSTQAPPKTQPPLPEDTSEGGASQFFWTYTEEPHRSRRQAIIKVHPEVTKLCGPEPLTKWLVLAVVALQVSCAWLLRDTHPLDWRFLATAYFIGATANQNLFLAIHEISHNLAFREAWKNRILAVFANLPIGIPYSASFRV